MVDVKELQQLVALCEYRHFGRAATSLGISQPALSKGIQRLEAALGVTLVERSSEGVDPTAVGQEVLLRAQTVIGGISELKREVELMQGLASGQLAVGIGPAMAESQLTTAVARLVERSSGVRIQIRVDHWKQLSEWLLDRQLDLFVADITEAKRDERFACHRLPKEDFVWFCRSGHDLSQQKRVTRQDLMRYPLATPRMPQWAQEWFAQATDAGGSSANNDKSFAATIECENYSILKRIVRSGDCVSAALRSTISAELAEGAVVPLRVRATTLKTQAGIVTLRDRSLSPLAEAMIAELKSAASDGK